MSRREEGAPAGDSTRKTRLGDCLVFTSFAKMERKRSLSSNEGRRSGWDWLKVVAGAVSQR